MSQVTTFTPEQITAAVKKLASAGKSLSRSVETVLVMAVYDSIVNQSAETANALIGALRKSTKRQGIVHFLEKFGQLYERGGKVGFVHFALGAQASLAWTPEYVETVQEEAQGWEDYKPEPAAKDDLDVVKLIEAVAAKIAKAKKNGETIINAELAEYIPALLAQYTAKMALAKAAEVTPAPAPTEALATV
jgi:hypothetical protein